MSKVTVAVIVTFNRLEKLKLTIKRTLEQPFHRVVVVNNASNDGTTEWLNSLTDNRLHVIHSSGNIGGAGGFNLGFSCAANEFPEADWLVAFDDDAYPEPDTLLAFHALDIPDEVGSIAGAVYLLDGQISEMNRPSVNPFWHLRELVATSLRGRRGFHVDDEDYESTSHLEVDASSFVGFFLRLSLIREQRIGLPRSELFIYADDIIYVLELRKAGLKHWFVPWLKFSHDCQTLVEQKDVYRPLWRVYYTFRNRLEMYRVASGIFYPFVLLVKVPKFFFSVFFYEAHERKRFLKVTSRALVHGVTRNYKSTFEDVRNL